MLKVEHLTVSYNKEYNALQNICFEVKSGEKVAFVGKKESGKTTLFRVLAGLEEYSIGNILYNNKELNSIDFKKDISLGYISKYGAFFENKSIYDNLKYVLKIRKIDESTIKNKIYGALNCFDLTNIKEQKVKYLSNFQKTRVQLARVSMRKIDFFIIDNVFSNLTDEEQSRVKNYIKQLMRDNPDATFIIGTESEDIANFFGARIINLSYGSIVNQI